jgi:hypothetical protein
LSYEILNYVTIFEMQLFWKPEATCIYILTSVLWAVTPCKLAGDYLLVITDHLTVNNLPWNRIISSFDLVEQLCRTRVIEWELAIQHGKQHHTQGPHVRRFAWNSVPRSLHANIQTSMITKSSISRDIMPYSTPKVNLRFGGTRCLHIQGWRISWARNLRESRWLAEPNPTPSHVYMSSQIPQSKMNTSHPKHIFLCFSCL